MFSFFRAESKGYKELLERKAEAVVRINEKEATYPQWQRPGSPCLEQQQQQLGPHLLKLSGWEQSRPASCPLEPPRNSKQSRRLLAQKRLLPGSWKMEEVLCRPSHLYFPPPLSIFIITLVVRKRGTWNMHFSFSTSIIWISNLDIYYLLLYSTICAYDAVLKLHLFIQKQNLSMRDPPLVILSIAAADHKNAVVMKN